MGWEVRVGEAVARLADGEDAGEDAEDLEPSVVLVDLLDLRLGRSGVSTGPEQSAHQDRDRDERAAA